MTKTALVTGASSGIGRALAGLLAADGYDIVAVAESDEALRVVADELAAKYGASVRPWAADLTEIGMPQRIYEQLKNDGVQLDVLVNDAGVGQRGRFVDNDLEQELRIVRLNVEALMVLSKLALRDMVARDRGRILNLGSVAGFQPGPLLAVYHATKAFVVSFSEAIATELSEMNSHVTVTCLCPGPTDTHFFERGDMEGTRAAQMAQEVEPVARAGYQAMMRGERLRIPHASNKLLTFARRVMPKSLQATLNKKLYEVTH